MKVFIVFSAIFMMGLTCIVYQGDMNAYMHEQETLKMIAEEAACRAALELDESAYGMGEMNMLPNRRWRHMSARRAGSLLTAASTRLALKCLTKTTSTVIVLEMMKSFRL